jgi:hypothetical protein
LTTCALLGTDALISLCAAPVIATLSISPNNGLALLAIISLIIWHWLITAHIIRHALSQSFSFALGIAFLYIFSAHYMNNTQFSIIFCGQIVRFLGDSFAMFRKIGS